MTDEIYDRYVNGKKARDFEFDDDSQEHLEEQLSLKVAKIEELEDRSNMPQPGEISLHALNLALDKVKSPGESLQGQSIYQLPQLDARLKLDCQTSKISLDDINKTTT